MEANYVPWDGLNIDRETFLEGRDDRARFAYHEGHKILLDILNRMHPQLSKDEADWLCDRAFELHMALYSVTLFEIHQKRAVVSLRSDDTYSNGWPVVWRDPSRTYGEGLKNYYEGIGEDIPEGAARMVSRPELAYEPFEDAEAMVSTFDVGAAPSDAWKQLYDAFLLGRIDIGGEDNSDRILTEDDGVLRPNWTDGTNHVQINSLVSAP